MTRRHDAHALAAALFAIATMTGARALAHDGHGEAHGEVTAREEEAYALAKPVFEKYCYACHATSTGHHNAKALAHIDMDTYPFGGHHAGEAGAAIREALGGTGKAPTMPDDDPGAVQGDDLAVVLAWADAFDEAHPAEAGHEHDEDHGDAHHVTVEEEHGQIGYVIPRETMIPGRPGMAGGYHFMINAFAQLENVGLGAHQIANAGGVESFAGGTTHPLLTGDWAMGYWRQQRGWAEALLMLNFEPLTVGSGGYPELGQSGEGLWDTQHPHLLVHQAMIAVHPLAGTAGGGASMEHEPDYDLSIWGGQGSAPIGPPIFMHRASNPGPTVPRKHHKGENPHETFPVLGASFRYHHLWIEGSVFSARELTPADSRLYPHPAAPASFAGRVRWDVSDWLEVQGSGERLRDQGNGAPDATQLSASAYAWGTIGGWRLDGLVDYALDDPQGETASHALLGEVAARDPSYRDILWFRTEFNQREESVMNGGGVSSPWLFETAGFERVFLVSKSSGLQVGLFGEATLAHIPAGLETIYGRENVVTVNVGLHLFGMWMLDDSFHRMAHHHGGTAGAEGEGSMPGMPGM